MRAESKAHANTTTKKSNISNKIRRLDLSTDEATNSENLYENIINPLPNIHVNELSIPFWFTIKKHFSSQLSPNSLSYITDENKLYHRPMKQSIDLTHDLELAEKISPPMVFSTNNDKSAHNASNPLLKNTNIDSNDETENKNNDIMRTQYNNNLDVEGPFNFNTNLLDANDYCEYNKFTKELSNIHEQKVCSPQKSKLSHCESVLAEKDSNILTNHQYQNDVNTIYYNNSNHLHLSPPIHAIDNHCTENKINYGLNNNTPFLVNPAEFSTSLQIMTTPILKKSARMQYKPNVESTTTSASKYDNISRRTITNSYLTPKIDNATPKQDLPNNCTKATNIDLFKSPESDWMHESGKKTSNANIDNEVPSPVIGMSPIKIQKVLNSASHLKKPSKDFKQFINHIPSDNTTPVKYNKSRYYNENMVENFIMKIESLAEGNSTSIKKHMKDRRSQKACIVLTPCISENMPDSSQSIQENTISKNNNDGLSDPLLKEPIITNIKSERNTSNIAHKTDDPINSQQNNNEASQILQASCLTNDYASSNNSTSLKQARFYQVVYRFARKIMEKKKHSKRQHLDYLQDIKIYNLISYYLDVQSLCYMTKVLRRFRSEHFISIIKKRLSNIIIKGLNPVDQYIYWNHFVNFSYLQNRYALQFSINFLKPSIYQRDIISDLDRTRIFNNMIMERQETLYKILLALSNSVPKIGYVQGFNTIVAVFLAHTLSDIEIYWLMNYALKKCKLEEMFSEGFPRVQILNYQLEIYMRNYLPEIVDHLARKGINLSYFTTQWFITMFSYELDFIDLTKIWNLFFIRGWKVLIRVAMSLLYIFKDAIFIQVDDDLPAYLKSFIRDNLELISQHNLFEISHGFKVTNRLLKILETLYEHSAPCNVLLTLNHYKKPEWKIISDNYEADGNVLYHHTDVMEFLNMNLNRRSKNLSFLNKSVLQNSKINANDNKDNLAFILKNHEVNNSNQALCNSQKLSREVIGYNHEGNENGLCQKDFFESLHNSELCAKDKSGSLFDTISEFGKKIRELLSKNEHVKADKSHMNPDFMLSNQVNLHDKKCNTNYISIGSMFQSPQKFNSTVPNNLFSDCFSIKEPGKISKKTYSHLIVTNDEYDSVGRGTSSTFQSYKKVIPKEKDEIMMLSGQSSASKKITETNTSSFREKFTRSQTLPISKILNSTQPIKHSGPLDSIHKHKLQAKLEPENLSCHGDIEPSPIDYYPNITNINEILANSFEKNINGKNSSECNFGTYPEFNENIREKNSRNDDESHMQTRQGKINLLELKIEKRQEYYHNHHHHLRPLKKSIRANDNPSQNITTPANGLRITRNLEKNVKMTRLNSLKDSRSAENSRVGFKKKVMPGNRADLNTIVKTHRDVEQPNSNVFSQPKQGFMILNENEVNMVKQNCLDPLSSEKLGKNMSNSMNIGRKSTAPSAFIDLGDKKSTLVNSRILAGSSQNETCRIRNLKNVDNMHNASTITKFKGSDLQIAEVYQADLAKTLAISASSNLFFNSMNYGIIQGSIPMIMSTPGTPLHNIDKTTKANNHLIDNNSTYSKNINVDFEASSKHEEQLPIKPNESDAILCASFRKSLNSYKN